MANPVLRYEVMTLPFKIVELDRDTVLALDRNFKEIERHLSRLQSFAYPKLASYTGSDHQFRARCVTYGLDADRPPL